MRRWRHHAAQHMATTQPLSRPATSASHVTGTDDNISNGNGQWVAEALSMVPLPPGWLRCSDSQGHTYYHHQPTSTSSWLHPLHQHFERLQVRLSLPYFFYSLISHERWH
jgi:hypothetical protein